MSNAGESTSTHVKTLEAIVNVEEKIVAKLLDALPDQTEAALTSAWNKFVDLVESGASSHDAADFVQGVRTVVKDVVAGQYDAAKSSLDTLIKTEADHVSSHLGNLIQAMAEFTSGNHGLLASMLQNAEANGLLSVPSQLAASIGSVHASST